MSALLRAVSTVNVRGAAASVTDAASAKDPISRCFMVDIVKKPIVECRADLQVCLVGKPEGLHYIWSRRASLKACTISGAGKPRPAIRTTAGARRGRR